MVRWTLAVCILLSMAAWMGTPAGAETSAAGDQALQASITFTPSNNHADSAGAVLPVVPLIGHAGEAAGSSAAVPPILIGASLALLAVAVGATFAFRKVAAVPAFDAIPSIERAIASYRQRLPVRQPAELQRKRAA
jgi:hypothetical protein